MHAVIGSSCHFKKEFVNSKVSIWCNELERLSSIAKSLPHAAYSYFVDGYKHKFTYYMGTIPNAAYLFWPVEDIISTKLIPTIFGQEISLYLIGRVLIYPHVTVVSGYHVSLMRQILS